MIHVDRFNVLGVFDMKEANNNNWEPLLHFPLNNADSIRFKKVRSSTGQYAIGRMDIKGKFSLMKEKVTIKMDLRNYNALVAASRSWP